MGGLPAAIAVPSHPPWKLADDCRTTSPGPVESLSALLTSSQSDTLVFMPKCVLVCLRVSGFVMLV